MTSDAPRFRLGAPTPIPMSQKRKKGATYFRFFSPKLNGTAECESPYEFKNLIRHEGTPSIVGLCPQPYRIEARINGKKLVTLIDNWVVDEGGVEFLEEVKPDGKLKRQDDGTRSPANWPLVERWAKSVKANVRFVTDVELKRDRMLIASWSRALPFLGPSVRRPAAETLDAIQSLVKQETSTTVREIVETLTQFEQQEVIAGVVQLLHDGGLIGDLREQLFSLATCLELPDA